MCGPTVCYSSTLLDFFLKFIPTQICFSYNYHVYLITVCLFWESTFFPQWLPFDLPELLLLLSFLFTHQVLPSDIQPSIIRPCYTFVFSPIICPFLSYAWFKLYSFSFLNKHHAYLFPCLKVLYTAYTIFTALCIILHSLSFLLEFTIFLAPNSTYSISKHSSRHISNTASSNGLFLENLLPSFLHCTTVYLLAICILLHHMILYGRDSVFVTLVVSGVYNSILLPSD